MKNTRNSRRNSSATLNNEDKAMKNTRNSRRNSSTNKPADKPADDPKKQAALAALAALGIDAAALFGNTADKPKKQAALAADKPADDPKKADRTYEIPNIGADFTKTAIYAAPKSDAAAAYMAAAKVLCADVMDNLRSDIAADVRRIAERAEKDGGVSLKDDLKRLADVWDIPAQSMRVIMQLCAPVVCCCNTETDEIARRCYGMARANALMGSACNTIMYAKATDKDGALPFKRVAHNLTTLGLDFIECKTVTDCDFCEDEDDFDELVTLCDMWLAKCTRIAPVASAAAPKTRGNKPADKPADDPKKQAALAALAALGIDAAALFNK